MDCYRKGENFEPTLETSQLPFQKLSENFVWIKVKPTTKMRTTIEFARKEITDKRTLVWTGIGPAIGKTISCAEIIRRRSHNVYQETKISYHKTEEHWTSSKTNVRDKFLIIKIGLKKDLPLEGSEEDLGKQASKRNST
nr:EOG090X0KMN [Scapholeberis mucronata]